MRTSGSAITESASVASCAAAESAIDSAASRIVRTQASLAPKEEAPSRRSGKRPGADGTAPGALRRSTAGRGFRAGLLTLGLGASLAFPTARRSVAAETRDTHHSGGTVGDFHPSSLLGPVG